MRLDAELIELTEERLILQERTKTGGFISSLINYTVMIFVVYLLIMKSPSGIWMLIGLFFIVMITLSYLGGVFIDRIVVDRKINKVQFISTPRAPKLGIRGKMKEINFSDIAAIEFGYIDGGEATISYWGVKIKTISGEDFETFKGYYEPLPRIIAEKISKLTDKSIVELSR